MTNVSQYYKVSRRLKFAYAGNPRIYRLDSLTYLTDHAPKGGKPVRFGHPKIKIRLGGICVAVGIFCRISLPDAARAGEIDTLVFGSLDAGAATFMTAGAKVGLPSLDRDGAVVLASLGGGRQGERGPEGSVQRYTVLGAINFGYQWFFDWGVVAAFAGPEMTTQMLTDPNGPTLLPSRFGLRLHGEIWARPSEDTLLQGSVVAGTALDSVWARAALGYRLWDTYFGPEASLYTDASGFLKLNVGLHATDFTVGRISFRISAGIQSETGRRSVAPYTALSVWSPL
ncbi:cellulose biosynthesis protein BcsS [Methylobacterium sp. J-088]|uniref:cellulose biosynthesis protein BcsS n=1 Tax=Methylobacterium sp. J-088 TaxID=2836664 RepID=UPI001FB9C767|nr:cellulose biosynthesis protein BcsS [Methylobacterium sp. J-088]MCJ2066907.1 cellulose biosynthesis protein BcsS [Methylobacterium sp. J-088]